jgi:hypothetical protein
MPKALKLVFAFLIYSLISLSVYALPICIVYLLFADTKSTIEILLFVAAEYFILYAIIIGVNKLLYNKRTKTVTQVSLAVLFIAIAAHFITTAPTSCSTTKYIDCD